MSDYLSMEETDGYLGLDEPAAPTSAPAPPTAPSSGGYLDDLDGGYLDGGMAQPTGHVDAGMHAPAPAAGYAPAPIEPAPYAHHAPAAQPQAPFNPIMGSELSVQAPYLESVHPGVRSIGGARPTLSSLVLDVEVPVEVYFGDAQLTVEEFLEMGPGSVVELDHAIEAAIELRVRGRLIARGQLVTINGNYGMRVTEMLADHGA